MSLYPLNGLPKQRQIWSWISFDVANQSFTLIINTLLFSIFFANVVVKDEATSNSMWALAFGGSMLLTAIASPIAGAIADTRACKKKMLLGSGILCGLLTCCFGFIQPGQLWLAFLLYVPANFLFSLGENFLASFLPALARPGDIGRVSGFSWAVAYFSALVLLVLTAGTMQIFGLMGEDKWRGFFVFAGVWFLAFCIPTALWLEEPPLEDELPPGRSVLAESWSRLCATVKSTAQFKDLALTLLASLFYGAGMSVVISFASILAAEYGFNNLLLVVFVAVITITGIIGTLIPTFYQDRIGHRRSVMIFVGLWLFTACAFAVYAHMHDAYVARTGLHDYPTWPLWVIGNLLGLGVGSLGSANRAFVGYMAPEKRSAEVFGMWGLVWKLSAVMTIPFGWLKDKAGTPASLWLLAGFLLIGAILTMFINEKRGFLAAQADDAGTTPPAGI